MDSFSFITLFVFIISLANSAFVFLTRPYSLLKTLWGLISLIVAFIGIHLFWMVNAPDAATAFFHSFRLNAAAIFLPVFFFHFTLLLTHRIEQKKWELVVYYIITFVYAALIMSYPTEFIPGVQSVVSLKYYCRSGPLFYFLPVWLGFLMSYGLFLVWRSYLTATPIKRNQLKYFFAGSAFGLVGGISAFLPAMNVPIYPWGVYLIPVNLLLVAYAIVKHQLMDIRFVVQKSLVYTVLISILVLFFVVMVFVMERTFQELFGYTSPVSSLIVAVLLVFILIPLYRWAHSFIDRVFYKGSFPQIVQENQRMRDEMIALERYKISKEIFRSLAEEIRVPLERLKIQSFGRALGQEVQEIEETLNQLDAYSRPLSSEFESFNIVALMEEVLKELQPQLNGERSTKIFKYYQPDEVAKILGNRAQLKEALSCILDHCRQVLHKTNGDVFVTIENDRRWASLSIRHSGKGLSAEEATRIFEPFFRTAYFKCGLHLLFAQTIILHHSGKIWLEAEEDVDTEFLVELPMV